MSSPSQAQSSNSIKFLSSIKRTRNHHPKYSNHRRNFHELNNLSIICFVILINCIVGNLCAWQENVRPKLYVELGKSPLLILSPLIIYLMDSGIINRIYGFLRSDVSNIKLLLLKWNHEIMKTVVYEMINHLC